MLGWLLGRYGLCRPQLVERLGQGRGIGNARQFERRIAGPFTAAEAMMIPDYLDNVRLAQAF